MMLLRPHIFFLISSSILLSACAVGPDHQTPAVPAPAEWHGPEPAVSGTPASGELRQWWRGFGDPLLNQLIETALQQNPDLQAAEAKLKAARAQTRQTAADRLPQVRATTAYEYVGAGQNSVSSSAGPLKILPLDVFLAGFDMSWELDLFGGVRRQMEAAEANANAQLESRRDVLVSVTAEIARQYLTLIALQHQFDIAQRRLDSVREQLRLAEGLYQEGMADQANVQAQRSLLASSEAALPGLDERIKNQRHGLATLLGLNPAALEHRLGHLAQELPYPPQIPAGLPSELLRRRPDIRQAEFTMASASASIGAALAELYPKITFSGMAGFQSQDIGNLSHYASGFYGFGPRLSLPIFQAGRLLANLDNKEEQHGEAWASYQKTVLNAFREVEDQLVSIHDEAQRRQELGRALSDAKTAETSSMALYQEGENDKQAALQKQGNALDAEDSLLQSQLTWTTHYVALFKALGGGWEAVDKPS